MIFLRRYRGSAKGGNTGRSELDSAPISESANKTDSPVEMEATERRVFELPTKSGLAESGPDKSRERYELATQNTHDRDPAELQVASLQIVHG
jgi:hypothetical protein